MLAPLPLDNWISNGNTDEKKNNEKTYTDSFPLKKTIYYNKNEGNVNTNSTIAVSCNFYLAYFNDLISVLRLGTSYNNFNWLLDS